MTEAEAADDENAQPPWEFDDEEPMEEIHGMMGVGVGASAAAAMTAVADAANPPHQHQCDANVNRDPDGEEDGDVEDQIGPSIMVQKLNHTTINRRGPLNVR